MRYGEADWLGLCLRSESDQPHEWGCLAWVVRNRVEARGYPDTYREVVAQPWQFSYFNPWRTRGVSTVPVDDALYEAAAGGYAGEESGWPDNNLSRAVECASAVMALPRYTAPFGPKVLHFWSRRSMQGGKDPSWASALRVFEVSGVDPQRWLFGETGR